MRSVVVGGGGHRGLCGLALAAGQQVPRSHALAYCEGGQAARSVEERRYQHAATRAPRLFQLFLTPLPSGEEALEMVGVLTSLLLPGGGAGAARVPFHVSAARLEQALIPKLSLLEAQGPGVSAEEHLAELRRHVATTRSAVAGGSGVGGAGPSAGSSAAAAAFETESLSSDFIALRQLADNMQTDSREDRIAVLDAALQSSLHLPRRVLTNGDKEAALCRSDATLAVILSLHPFLHEYFTLAVVMEPSGEIPPGLEDWSITGFAGRDPTFLQSPGKVLNLPRLGDASKIPDREKSLICQAG